MATYFNVTLDTAGPTTPSVSINAGAAYTGDDDVTLTIGTADGDTTNYQVKIYGDVDDSFAPAEYRAVEGSAPWVAYNVSKSVRLSATDGAKTVKIKIRDDVYNESTEATDGITLDTSIPTPTVSVGPDVSKISKIAGKRVVSFSFQADVIFEEYKIKVVPATNSLQSAGTTVLTTNGSTNMAGAAGGYPATTNINCTIDGRDLEVASSGDGAKIVKVFVKDAALNWSV